MPKFLVNKLTVNDIPATSVHLQNPITTQYVVKMLWLSLPFEGIEPDVWESSNIEVIVDTETASHVESDVFQYKKKINE